ncbi:MAG TPA: gliding motility protein GldN [Flavobacteriaceae bacterium]|nr:gliding motility protein GldN [Flavobacteriaceae bacterium]HEX5742885.1 gliding motility protein GldN [Flavobacteriaceae bacterium]
MKFIKNIILILILFITTNSLWSQANLLNAKDPSEIGKKNQKQLIADNDEPLPYGFVDDRDILWSKVVWEYIDLNERLNLPLYYPTESNQISSDRRSLFETLLNGINTGKITQVYDDDYFTQKLTAANISKRLVRVDTADGGFAVLNTNPNANIEEYIDRTALTSQSIIGFEIKGVWYFDKKLGELKYRLLGIAPMAPDIQRIGRGGDPNEKIPVFWVYYPDARDVLHRMKIFNPKNSAYPISFDHVLNSRRFSAVITREENIYGNRKISDYIRGNSLFQVLEAEKIKDGIRNKELDMWNY